MGPRTGRERGPGGPSGMRERCGSCLWARCLFWVGAQHGERGKESTATLAGNTGALGAGSRDQRVQIGWSQVMGRHKRQDGVDAFDVAGMRSASKKVVGLAVLEGGLYPAWGLNLGGNSRHPGSEEMAKDG